MAIQLQPEASRRKRSNCELRIADCGIGDSAVESVAPIPGSNSGLTDSDSLIPQSAIRNPQSSVLVHPDLAAAIYRAAAWPMLGESCGYAGTVNGDSAMLIGPGLVRVCRMHKSGGEMFTVNVSGDVPFELAEEK